jgi:hypothetical protein
MAEKAEQVAQQERRVLEDLAERVREKAHGEALEGERAKRLASGTAEREQAWRKRWSHMELDNSLLLPKVLLEGPDRVLAGMAPQHWQAELFLRAVWVGPWSGKPWKAPDLGPLCGAVLKKDARDGGLREKSEEALRDFLWLLREQGWVDLSTQGWGGAELNLESTEMVPLVAPKGFPRLTRIQFREEAHRAARMQDWRELAIRSAYDRRTWRARHLRRPLDSGPVLFGELEPRYRFLFPESTGRPRSVVAGS